MKSKREKKPLYMISVVAEMFSIHPQTLRTYERGRPDQAFRTVGNTRLYSEEDVERIEMITRLIRELGSIWPEWKWSSTCGPGWKR